MPKHGFCPNHPNRVVKARGVCQICYKKLYLTNNEKTIKQQIRSILSSCNIFHWNAWAGPFSEKGIADLIGIYEGKPLAIEVKGPRGKVSLEQEEWLKCFREAGGIAFVAYSPDDVIKELRLNVKLAPLFTETGK